MVLRKVKRAAEAARRDANDSSDIEAEDDESSMIVGKSINIKKERGQTRRRMEEIDADDD